MYRAALPHLMLNLEQAPLRLMADPVVLAALDQNQRETQVVESPPDENARGLVEIVAHVQDGPAAYTRRAQVSFDAAPRQVTRFFRILAWDSGSPGNQVLP